MADSIAIKVIAMGTATFAVFWIVTSFMLNVFFGGYDNIKEMGMMSVDTINHVNVMVDIWALSPLIFLVGLVWWVIERAKGTNITPSLFYMYEFVLILSIMYSLVMLTSIGTIVDILQSVLFSTQMLALMSLDLMRAADDLFQTGVSLVYAYCLFPGYAGCILYILHPATLQTDTMFSGEDTAPTEYVTDWQQM